LKVFPHDFFSNQKRHHSSHCTKNTHPRNHSLQLALLVVLLSLERIHDATLRIDLLAQICTAADQTSSLCGNKHVPARTKSKDHPSLHKGPNSRFHGSRLLGRIRDAKLRIPGLAWICKHACLRGCLRCGRKVRISQSN